MQNKSSSSRTSSPAMSEHAFALLGVEEREELLLLGVIRTRRGPEGRPYAAVFCGDQILDRERLRRRIRRKTVSP